MQALSPDQYGLIQLGELRVGLVETSRLSARRDNPRAMSKAEYAALQKSVERFGFKSFVVVEELEPGRYGVIDGHHRWKVAVEQGMERIPVVLIDGAKSDMDLAMLTFNITGTPTDESYFDLLSDLMKSFDTPELAAALAISSDFLADMSLHVDTISAGEQFERDPLRVRAGRDEENRWQAHPIRVDMHDTPEVRELLAKARTETEQATDGQAVFEILRRYFNPKKAETPDGE